MPGNLPPPPPPPPGRDGPGISDLASEQRARILASGSIGGQSPDGSSAGSKLDGLAKSILKKKGIISPDPLPNIDQMVIMFLREHDVDVRPPSGTKAGDAVSGAFFGAFGPAASFAGSHLRQQEKIAAMQEWTSWKQWALGHADWPTFKERLKQDYEENQEVIKETVSSPWFKSEYQEALTRKRKSDAQQTKVLIIVGAALASLYVLVIIGGIVNQAIEKMMPSNPSYSRPDYWNRD